MKSVFFFTCYLLVSIKVECQVFEKSVGDVRINNDENKVQQLQGSTKAST